MGQHAKLNLISQKLKIGRLLGPYTHLEKRVSGVHLLPRPGAPEMSKGRKLRFIAHSGKLHILT